MSQSSLAVAIEHEYLFGNKEDGTEHPNILSAITSATEATDGSVVLHVHCLKDGSVIVVDVRGPHPRFKTVSGDPRAVFYGESVYRAIQEVLAEDRNADQI